MPAITFVSKVLKIIVTLIFRMPTQKKLILSLNNKNKYTVHSKTLALYKKLGLKVTKVHKVIAFKQRAWLKPYVEHTSGKRREAKSKYKKKFYKNATNQVFGKGLSFHSFIIMTY